MGTGVGSVAPMLIEWTRTSILLLECVVGLQVAPLEGFHPAPKEFQPAWVARFEGDGTAQNPGRSGHYLVAHIPERKRRDETGRYALKHNRIRPCAGASSAIFVSLEATVWRWRHEYMARWGIGSSKAAEMTVYSVTVNDASGMSAYIGTEFRPHRFAFKALLKTTGPTLRHQARSSVSRHKAALSSSPLAPPWCAAASGIGTTITRWRCQKTWIGECGEQDMRADARARRAGRTLPPFHQDTETEP